MVDNIPPEWGIPLAVVLTVIWLIVRKVQNRTGGED